MERKKEFFKGILGFTERDDELLAKKAEESIYRWWWEFMRIHPVFWYARTKGVEPQDPLVYEMFHLMGDMSHYHFSRWWRETGRKVFAEAKEVPKVTAIDIFSLDKHPFKEKGVLYLDIPLDITRRTIMKQIRLQLDKVHESRSLNVTKHSSAALKLYTKKYRLKTIENEFYVLLYRMINSKIRMWQIGDRLQLAPAIKVRCQEKNAYLSKKVNKLNSLTGRYYYKARNTLDNLLLKQFPNYSLQDFGENFMPFGAELHEDYLRSTKLVADRRDDVKKRKTFEDKIKERNEVHSEFHEWLIKNYASVIKWRVIEKNHIGDQHKLPGSKVWRKLPQFINGLDDQL